MGKVIATDIRGSGDYEGSITFLVNGELCTAAAKVILLKQNVICIIDSPKKLSELGITGHAKYKNSDGKWNEGDEKYVYSPGLAKAMLKVGDMLRAWKDPDGVLLAEEAEIE